MGQIVRFEWLKMKRKRYIWNLLCILIVINSYHIFQISQSGKTMMEGHEKIERQVEGKITDEKISFVTAHYKKYLKMVQEGTFSKEGNQKGTYTGYIMGDYNEFEVYPESVNLTSKLFWRKLFNVNESAMFVSTK